MIQKFCHFWLYKVLGWRLKGHIPRETRQLLVVLLPHTSNWDFIIGLLFVISERLDITLFGKDNFYVWPIKYLYKLFNVEPVDRENRSDFVEQVVVKYNANPKYYWTAIAPEGSRAKTKHLKSGYFHLAQAANIPILKVGLDYDRRAMVIAPPRPVLKSFAEDSKELLKFSKSIYPANPQNTIL